MRDPFRNIYELLLGEDDARACKDISEDACREQPKSFGIHVVATTLSKIGDGISDVKLTLTWVLASLGVPPMLVSWVVPLRESLSLLPQLAFANQLRSFPKRKLFWTFGSITQGLCIFAVGVASLFLKGAAAGYTILLLLALFSLARGFCSIAGKDVLGKTVAKKKRGRVSGLATALAGFGTLVFGGFLYLELIPTGNAALLSGLLFFAGGLWLVAGIVYSGVPEFPGTTEGGRNGLREALSSLKLIVTDRSLRHFLMTRCLFISTALVAPFYVILANRYTDGGMGTLGLLLFLAGLANLTSGTFWGKLADHSSKHVLAVAGTICGLLALTVTLATTMEWPIIHRAEWYAAVIFVLYIGHAGVRLGRKTYLIDMATQDNRAQLVAVSNTFIGTVLLAIGGLSTFVSRAGVLNAIAILGLFSFIAAISALAMKNVSD
ncbi:MAG: MFS transporter [Desulfuromonas sp.]|nr:MAG: MFS transporter [Desulfuromonas sp.]